MTEPKKPPWRWADARPADAPDKEHAFRVETLLNALRHISDHCAELQHAIDTAREALTVYESRTLARVEVDPALPKGTAILRGGPSSVMLENIEEED